MFEGFTPEAFDFLWGIRFNNDKAWFEENKKTYTDRLYQPMKQLAAEVFAPLSDMPGMLCKVSLWFCIRRECLSWSEHPALFFEIAPEGCTYGFGLIHPKASAMTALRAQLAEQPREFLDIVNKLERSTDIRVGGEEYYRKKGTCAPELERFYNLKNVSAWREVAPGPELFTPELSAEVRGTLTALLPLYSFFLRFTERPLG